MTRSIKCWISASAVIVVVVAAGILSAQEKGKTYLDSRGKKIVFPLGDASFADEVVSLEVGKPAPPDKRWTNAAVALGPPNYKRNATATNPTDVVIGCAGTLVVRFVDNVLIDVPGPDLYVFEVGPQIEAMRLAISMDGSNWIAVGDIKGGTAEVDIAKASKPGDRFRFVKVTDLKSGCSGQHPGADIDAIGAIGSGFSISFDASVLFEFNKFTLLPQAQTALVEAAQKIAAFPGSAASIEGHTDNVGANDYNMKLSQSRAEAVRTFLLSRPELRGRALTAKGWGATRPLSSNDSEDGRQKNRRVEIVINAAP